MNRRIEEKGATLLELTVSLAIIAFIMVAVFGLIYQEWSGTATAKSSITISREIGNASRLISRDAAMAASTNLVEGNQPTDQLILNWVERDEFVDLPHSAGYWLEGDELLRNYDGIVTTIARNISKIEFSQANRLLTVTIGCNPHWWILDKTGEKTYRVFLRPTEDLY